VQNGLFTLSSKNVLSGQGFLQVKIKENEGSETKLERLSELREVTGGLARKKTPSISELGVCDASCCSSMSLQTLRGTGI